MTDPRVGDLTKVLGTTRQTQRERSKGIYDVRVRFFIFDSAYVGVSESRSLSLERCLDTKKLVSK